MTGAVNFDYSATRVFQIFRVLLEYPRAPVSFGYYSNILTRGLHAYSNREKVVALFCVRAPFAHKQLAAKVNLMNI